MEHAAHVASQKFLAEVGPEAQFEDDTCGVHTLRVIYKAYGLEPDGENLRARLGVDVPSNPADEMSTGTLQPDILRVLVQDGFRYEFLDLENESEAAARLAAHLRGGDMAAVLIRRRENGHMHWVAAYRMPGEEIEVLDSLVEKSYLEEPEAFVAETMLSCVLVKPSGLESEDYARATVDGTRELISVMERYREIGRKNVRD